MASWITSHIERTNDMNALDRQSRLTAGLEALGELRVDALAYLAVDRAAFDAAVVVVASALDDEGRAALAAALPAQKAALDADNLGTLSMVVAELLRATTPASKSATKGSIVYVAPPPYDPYAQAADNLRAVIDFEDRADKSRVEAADGAAWVETWLEYGRRRTAKVALLARAASR